MKLYGITVADYDRMLSEQDGKCGICKRDTPSTNPRFQFFAVDHCHKSGKVRGLLCQKCNGTLGWHEANAESILGYLEKANS